MVKEEKTRILTAPNILSFLRILLIPVFLLMMLWGEAFEALAVFLLAGLTDLLDGLTARLWHQKTRIGALLDPAADKLLMTTAFIVLTIPSLSSPNSIPLWLTLVVIGRDLIIVTGAFIVYKIVGQKSFNPSIMGKASTSCQVTVVLLLLFFNSLEISPPYLRGIFYLTLITTLLSGVHYAYIGFRMIFPPKLS